MLFNNPLRRESHVFVCTCLNTNMCIKSQRGAYTCTSIFVFLINSPVVCDVKIFKNINCAAFALVTWFRIASFVVELILYTFGMGGMSVFFLRIEFDIITL